MALPTSDNTVNVTRLGSILSTLWTKIKTALSGKQDKLTSQTAYSAKGTATKVPQITTNSLGQVTSISEVTISGVTPASHASTATTYGIGTTSNYGHVKLATGDMNGATNTDGVAVSKNHTHSQYAPKASPALTGTPTAPTAADGTNTTQIATTAFVQSAVAQGLSVSDAMVYKGTITLGATSPGGLTVAADKGHTYKVVANGNTKEGYVDGVKVEAGDMVICNADSTAAATSSNYSTIAAKWDFVQGNTDGVVVGPASATSGNVVVFDGATGKLVKDGGKLGTAAFKDVASSGNASTTQVVMGNDSRLTDSRTPASHTHGNISNDGAITSTTQSSDITIATGDKLLVTDSSNSNKVVRTGAAFDTTVTNTYLCKNGTFIAVKEADVTWGGSFRTDLSPVEAAGMARNIWHNPLPSAIKYEKTTDGGSTWTEVAVTDAQKQNQFNLTVGWNFGIANAEYSGVTDTTLLRARITVYCMSSENVTAYENTWCYGQVKRLFIYCSRAGTANLLVEGQTGPHSLAHDDVWTTFGNYAIAGDTGWNSIPFDNRMGGYSGQLAGSGYTAYRFTYWITSGTSPRIHINRIGVLPAITYQSRATAVATIGMPLAINGDGSGIIKFANQLYTARKLAVSLSNTSTDTSFNGSADVTNIKVTGTLPVANGGTGATTAKGASYNINAGMNSGDSDAIVDSSRFAFNYANPSATSGGLYYRTAPKVWDWIKGKLTSVSGVNISGNAATASAAQSGSALETAINAKQNALTINDSKPITIGTAAAANTVAGQAHTHDGITSVARASVTNIDISNSGTEPARMTLSQVTSKTTQGTDPGDGYVLNLLWDNDGNWDTQIYVPNSKKADKDFGHLKIRYKNESSTWGDWEYLPGAFMGTLLTSNDDLDTLYQGLTGEVIQYYWKYTSKPICTSGLNKPGMIANNGLPTGTGSANLYAFHQSSTRTSEGIIVQVMICEDVGIYYRHRRGSSTGENWSQWTKVLLASDITTNTSTKNGKITIAGSDLTVYVHPAGSAASKTGVPTANATPAFGGTFKVNQITTDATSHVSAVTERTITIPNTTGNASTAGLTKLYTATGTNTDGTMTQNAIKSALDTKMGSTVSEDASNELQVVGVQSSATSTLKRDSGVTVQGGAVKATTFKLGTNATITYNSTTEAIDFTFL